MRESGFLNINKPPDMTSHDVVAKIRRGLKVKKVGHAGTLDPLATGVLVICMGVATRLSEYAMASAKTYRATVHLGVTTTTYDAEGETISQQDAAHISRQDVEQALPQFLGAIEQLPPMYSAVKQGGRKLYELARAGKEVEREPRSVTIESLQLVEWTPPTFTLDVVCSAGTYIRSLAFDLGEALGVGAHLAGLVRMASGRFSIDASITLDNLLDVSNWWQYLLPLDFVLQDFRAVNLDETETDHVLHGRPVVSDMETLEGELARAYDNNGQFIAILKAQDNRWRPHKVFIA